jgi:rod shape-determining protein MreC
MWRRTARDRVFIGLLVLATVVVLTLDFRTGVLQGVSGVATQVVGVFQGGVRSFVRPFQSIFRTMGDLATLRDQNRRLLEENRRLRLETETFGDVARENVRFRTLLQLEEGSGLLAVHAEVIGSSLSGLERSVLIDKGTAAHIAPDHAVLAPEGLAGRVILAGTSSAKVLLLTDAQSAVGVRIGESGETGLVRGTGGGELDLELVSRAALDQGAVKPGDVVVTSGYQGSIYPPGLPVGRIDHVTLAPRGTSYTITVQPFVRFSALDVVSVIVGRAPVIQASPTPRPSASPSPPASPHP